MRILLVEDTEFISFLYKRQLEKAGLKTDICATGKETFTALDKHTYHLILLDMLLPDMNGMDILKRLKSNEKTKNIPVLLLSNLGQDNIIEQSQTLGAVGYLVKNDYSPDEIVQKVKDILANVPQ